MDTDEEGGGPAKHANGRERGRGGEKMRRGRPLRKPGEARRRVSSIEDRASSLQHRPQITQIAQMGLATEAQRARRKRGRWNRRCTQMNAARAAQEGWRIGWLDEWMVGGLEDWMTECLRAPTRQPIVGGASLPRVLPRNDHRPAATWSSPRPSSLFAIRHWSFVIRHSGEAAPHPPLLARRQPQMTNGFC